MTRFNRRKLLASGTALGVTGLFGSLSTAADEHGEEDDEIPDSEDVDGEAQLSDGAQYLELIDHRFNECVIEVEIRNVSDEYELTVEAHGSASDSDGEEVSTYTGSRPTLTPDETGVATVATSDPDHRCEDVREYSVAALVLDREEHDEEEADEEPEDEEEADDDEPTDKADLDLSVSAPDSIPYEETADPSEDAADFCITVTNHGDETVSVDGQFDIGPIDEPLPLDLEPGETETAHYGVMSRDLGPGDHEWIVTANGETETGTLTVTDDEEC